MPSTRSWHSICYTLIYRHLSTKLLYMSRATCAPCTPFPGIVSSCLPYTLHEEGSTRHIPPIEASSTYKYSGDS